MLEDKEIVKYLFLISYQNTTVHYPHFNHESNKGMNAQSRYIEGVSNRAMRTVFFMFSGAKKL